MATTRANLLLLLFLGFLAGAIYASSHSEAPETSVNPTTDATDFYFFRSYETGRQNYVTAIANYLPFQNPYGGPNYFALSTDVAYEIALDLNGDAAEDVIYRFVMGYNLGGANQSGIALNINGTQVPVPLKFIGPVSTPNDPNLNFVEYYRLYKINVAANTILQANDTATGNTQLYKPLDNVGVKTIPDYNKYAAQFQYKVAFSDCAAPARAFVGQRRESFAVNLGGIFDLVDFVPIDAASGFAGGIVNNPSNNILRFASVTSFVLELPLSCINVAANNGVIGAWTRTRVLSHATDGTHVVGRQVQRLGNPLVNELVIGLADKDRWNSQNPADEIQFAPYVLTPTLPEILDFLFLDAVNSVLQTTFTTLAPTTPRNDLVAVFLTGIAGINQPANPVPGDMLRLNVNIAPTALVNQSSMGVIGGDSAGFPNGRRPGDDVVDIALRVVMGKLYSLGLFGTVAGAPVGEAAFTDGAPISAANFTSKFPYLLDPLPGSSFDSI